MAASAPGRKPASSRRSLRLSRVLWGLSLPLMFAEVSEIILHVTDTIFLARVGVAELGAVAIADSIWEIFLVLPLGLVDGIQILTARHLGRKRPRAVGAVFNQGFWLILALSMGFAALLAARASWLSRGLVQSPDVAAAMDSFLRISSYGLPFTAATFAYGALLVSLGRTRVLVPATLILAVTNGVLDYVLIFGKLGLPAMGIRGAAWGSVGAEVTTFGFLTTYLVAQGHVRRFRLFRWAPWSGRSFRRLTQLSAPVSLQALVEAFRWFAFFLIVERIGAAALAVANVVYACYEVFRIPTEAFGEATCSMVSRFIGRDRPDRIGLVVRESIRAAFLATLPMIALSLFLPDWVLSVFTLDEALLDAAIGSLRIVALAMLVVIPAEMWFTAVLGTGDTPAALGIEVVLTIVMLAATYAVSLWLSGRVELVWCSLLVAWVVVLTASYGWMKMGTWRRVTV